MLQREGEKGWPGTAIKVGIRDVNWGIGGGG